jgi:hypothetical protein
MNLTPQPVESLKVERGEAIEGNAADDILMVDQGDFPTIYSSLFDSRLLIFYLISK